MNQPNIHSTIVDLLNRQFQIRDIKEHLLSTGYTSEEIDAAINQALEARANSTAGSGTVSNHQGAAGVRYIVVGLLIIVFAVATAGGSDNKVFTWLKLIVGVLILIYGIVLSTRPLKDDRF